MLVINPQLTIERRFVRVGYVRSRGPGGQNVNKVNTRAQLRFDLKECKQLSRGVKQRLKTLAGRRLTREGIIVIESDRFREQKQNRQECLERLRKMITKALVRPKKRIPTKPTASSKKKRLADKKHRSRLKSYRGRVKNDEE
jgi:ribosome-associated protein